MKTFTDKQFVNTIKRATNAVKNRRKQRKRQQLIRQ